MKRLISILLLTVVSISLYAQKPYKSHEEIVSSYESIIGKNVTIKIGYNDFNYIYFMVDGKLKKATKYITTSDFEKFINTSSYIDSEATIKGAKYLIVRNDGITLYLPEEAFPLSYFVNWNRYQEIVDELNSNCQYLKVNGAKNKYNIFAPTKNSLKYDGQVYFITWELGTVFKVSHSSDPFYFNIKGGGSGHIKGEDIDYNDFLSKDEILAYERQEEIKTAERNTEDTKVHAFRVDIDYVSEKIEKGDTVFMYDNTHFYHLNKDCSLPTYLTNHLTPLLTYDNNSHIYSSFDGYIDYVNNQGSNGLDLRKEIAYQADSIYSHQKLQRLKIELAKANAEYEAEVKQMINEYKQKKIFITNKEYAFGNFSDFGLELTFYNCFSKTIKYISFETSAYNTFGDLQGDYVGKKISGGRCIGPIEPTEFGTYKFDDLYYDKNDVIHKVRVTKVTFTFIDGSTQTFTDVSNHCGPGVDNSRK